MDIFYPKQREDGLPDNRTLFLSEEYMKPSSILIENDFPFEVPDTSKKARLLQDFHHLDPLHVNTSSWDPAFGVQTHPYDPFDASPYGGSSTSESGFYESKLFADHINGGHSHVMDNFPNGDQFFYNIPHQENPLDHHVTTRSNQNYQMVLFDYPEIKPLSFVLPDEVTSFSADSNYYKGIDTTKSRNLASRKTWKGRKKPNFVKGQWTAEEDRRLIQLVGQYGVRKWSHIAQMLRGRIGKQCRERWHNHLRPDIKKDTWTEEEDKVLIEAHTEIGNKWAEIAKRLPGRTENSIKNHWNATKRRQLSKRKCRSKHPRGSLLQEYIKGLNLDLSSGKRGRHKEKNNAINNSKNNNNNNNNNGNGNIGVMRSGIMGGTENDNNSSNNERGLEFYYGDQLVPGYTLDDGFSFDEQLLGESCNLDSLLDGLPEGDDGLEDQRDKRDCEMDGFKVDDGMANDSSLDFEGKKELDLVEMISQAKV